MLFSRETRKKLAALRKQKLEEKAQSPEELPAAPAAEAPREGRPASASPEPEAEKPLMAGLTRDRLKARVKARRKGALEPPPDRGPLQEPPPKPKPERSAEPHTTPSAWLTPPPGPAVPAHELLPGKELTTEAGTCYVMRPEPGELCSWAGSVGVALRESASRLSAAQRDMAFLDIETAGLSGMPVFLVGILRCVNGELSVAQFLSRDYPEEAALLELTVRELVGCTVLYTYNGASFDIPYLRDRATYYSVDFNVEAEHIDLLKPARRRFRGRWADCKLQTLERELCGRERGDDIPGAEIPRVYQEFVRTQDARLLASIIRHNVIDILTLAEILPHCV